ncbi:DUF1801 domain-containing protein [Bosea sp. MMO-172]|uniref:DUF1801 domain-containing protein n=1 Tax=Bosea sp. MMO-172 TaxID=3127885 RepID=UPI003018AC0A
MPVVPFHAPDVAARYQSFPAPLRGPLLELRQRIFDVAAARPVIGTLQETLKWNEPAYHPVRPRIGTTIRLGPLRAEPEAYALFVHCQTSLADTFRQLYPDALRVDGARTLVFRLGEPVPAEALDHCIALALTYHLKGEISAG